MPWTAGGIVNLHTAVRVYGWCSRMDSALVSVINAQLSIVWFNHAIIQCGLMRCKNRACPVCWPEVVGGIPNQGVIWFVSFLFVSLLCLGCMLYFVSLFLVVCTSIIDCKETLVSKMTCYVSIGTLNLTHTLTHLFNSAISCTIIRHITTSPVKPCSVWCGEQPWFVVLRW